MKKTKILFILFALFISTTNVYAETLPYDPKYGTRDESPAKIPDGQADLYTQTYVGAANHKIVKREGNKIDVLYIGYWSVWANSNGEWVTTYNGQTLKPFGKYTLGNTTYLGNEAREFLYDKKGLNVSSIKIPSLSEINEFQSLYEKPNVQFFEAIRRVSTYGILDGTIVTKTTKLSGTSTPIEYTYSATLRTSFNGTFDSSKPSNTGDLADGMGLNVKTLGRNLKVLGTVFYAPFIITIEYEEPCNEDAASDKNSPYFKDYWTISGTASNPVYTPTKYAADCACTTVSEKMPIPVEIDFYNKMYDKNGGYYVNSGDKKGTSLLKISCPVVVIEKKCDVDKYYAGTMTSEELSTCCEEGAPGFGEDKCPVSKNNFNLFCNTNLTETKTYKSNTEELPSNEVCSVKCEEEGTFTFKPNQYVIAGQKLNYDFVYNSKKTCKATYKMTPVQFTTSYNSLVTTRVKEYNEYLAAKKALDDYVSDKKCATSAQRTVYYTCTKGNPNGDICEYKEDYEETTTGSTSYICERVGLSTAWYEDEFTEPSGTASCSDGGTASYSLKNSGTAPSGTCSLGSTTSVSDTYAATCQKDATSPADYHCDCTNSVGLTCSAYDSQVVSLTSAMNTQYNQYQTALSNERSLMTYKNSCDNFVTSIDSNASFEFKIEEESFNTYIAREVEQILSSNVLRNQILSSIRILSCGITATSCSLAANAIDAVAYTSWDKLSETNFNYTYPDEMYIDRITAKASATTPADYYFGGYNYYTSLSTLTGRYELSVVSNGTFGSFEQWRMNDDEVACWYDLDNKLGPTPPDPNFPLYGSNGLAFRVVKLSDLFPNNRESGTNWQSEDDLVAEIESKGDSIYAGIPKYRIVITPQAMKSVREYNEDYAYNNWSNFDFIENTTEGRSDFLKDIDKFKIKMTVNKTQ